MIEAGLDAELYGLSAKPAASLDAERAAALTAQPGWTSARRGWASPSRVRGDTIVASRRVGTPEEETVRDNFDAPGVCDGHIDIHASLPADSRDGMF